MRCSGRDVLDPGSVFSYSFDIFIYCVVVCNFVCIPVGLQRDGTREDGFVWPAYIPICESMTDDAEGALCAAFCALIFLKEPVFELRWRHGGILDFGVRFVPATLEHVMNFVGRYRSKVDSGAFWTARDSGQT